jgi:hypothetical protein
VDVPPPEKNAEVVGFTSMSPSTKANAYQWASAIADEIDLDGGWGPEDVVGGECTVVLEVAEDAQGVEKNKVVKVKARKREAVRAERKRASTQPNVGTSRL